MTNLSKKELIKLYEAFPEDTLQKLGVHDEAKKCYEEKEGMMEEMMPRMMANLTFEEKMQLMGKMMPTMMADMDMSQMDGMMDTMMPTMMSAMQDKGMDMFAMMGMMCPKCISVASAQTSSEDKAKLKEQMSSALAAL